MGKNFVNKFFFVVCHFQRTLTRCIMRLRRKYEMSIAHAWGNFEIFTIKYSDTQSKTTFKIFTYKIKFFCKNSNKMIKKMNKRKEKMWFFLLCLAYTTHTHGEEKQTQMKTQLWIRKIVILYVFVFLLQIYFSNDTHSLAAAARNLSTLIFLSKIF